jgi:hypothetical protein
VIINRKNGNKNITRYKFAIEQLSFKNYFLQYLNETIKNITVSGNITIKSNAKKKLEAYSYLIVEYKS